MLIAQPLRARKPARSRSWSQLTVAATTRLLSPGAGILGVRVGVHDRPRDAAARGAPRVPVRRARRDARRRPPVPRLAPQPAVRPAAAPRSAGGRGDRLP